MSEIVITGMGICTALGAGVEVNREALVSGRSGIGPLSGFSSRYAGVLPVGEVRYPLVLGGSGVTRTMQLASLALSEAVGSLAPVPGTALINATTVGGMCLTDELYRDANLLSRDSEYLYSYDGASVAMFLRERFSFDGIINTINTACSSSANSIGYGARLLRQGLARRVIAGGVDSLAKFTVNGFQALHILAPGPCTPFDRDRQGLNLGEGAAFLVLERASDVAPGSHVFARLSGYGNANDAYHPSSLSSEGDGPYLAMSAALSSAGLAPSRIGYINAHGTGTENNDEVESRAMIRLFGNSVPPFSSTKSFTGHTLGAAGAVEAVFSILGLTYGEVYPNLRFSHPIPELGLTPVISCRPLGFDHVMSNSFGFGGNCSSLIFSRV